MLAAALVMLLSQAGAPARAQAPPAADRLEGRPVVSIRQQPKDPAETPLDPAAFEQLLALQPGTPFSSAKIRETIEHLYATGRFADIQADASIEPGGVAVSFVTRARYFIGVVRIEGAPPPPSENQLQSATGLRLGYPYSEQDLPAVTEQLQQELENDGYFRAAIDHRVVRHPASQQADLYFEIRAGERARLGEVRISGSPVFPPPRILQEAHWRPGKSFTSTLVQSGLTRLRNLYRKENYLEATLSIRSRQFHPETNRVDLELDVVAGIPVEVSLTGARVGESKLRQLLPIYQEGTLDQDLLREGERNLRDYFESQGYFEVQVASRRDTSDAARVRIEYTVNLGPRQHLERIEISGNRYFQTAVLRERMRIQPARARLRYGVFSRTLLDQDVEAIRGLYQSNGFAEVQVRPVLQLAPGSRDGLLVSIEIQEGPQTYIGNFTLTGNHAFSQDQLAAYINAASGQPYSESMVNTDRNNLLTFYWNAGFPRARFDSRATPSPEAGKENLEYILDEGEPESVAHIVVGGLEHTRVGIVNRQLQLRDGEPLSQGQMLETQRRLYDLGIFSRVELGVQNPAAEERRRDVLVYLEEARRYTLKLGLGAEVGRFGGSTSDPTNVEGNNQFSPDVSLDVTRLNVGGRPHTASLRSRFSALQKRVALAYSAPRFLNHETLNASAQAFFDDTRDVRTFTARRWESSLQFESKRSRTTTLLARYAFRRVTVSNLNVTPDQVPLLSQPVLVGLGGVSWIRDSRDTPANARQGRFDTVDLAVAARQLGSQASFVRALIQSASYHPIGRRFVLARSTQFGVQNSFGKERMVEVNGQQVSTREIPLAERFFAGGGSSHRGFGLNQAGPRDLITGFAIGGNALLLNSLELRFPVWGQSISGVLFEDTGNVYSKISSLSFRQSQKNLTDFNYMSHAVGLGVRYNTPVAPVRFDVGYDLNPTRFCSAVDLTALPSNARACPTPAGTALPSGQELIEQRLSRWQFLFSIGQTF